MKIYLFFNKKNGIVIRYTGRLGSWVNRQIVGFPEILKKNAEFIGVITGRDISFQGYCLNYQDWKRIYIKKEKK